MRPFVERQRARSVPRRHRRTDGPAGPLEDQVGVRLGEALGDPSRRADVVVEPGVAELVERQARVEVFAELDDAGAVVVPAGKPLEDRSHALPHDELPLVPDRQPDQRLQLGQSGGHLAPDEPGPLRVVRPGLQHNLAPVHVEHGLGQRPVLSADDRGGEATGFVQRGRTSDLEVPVRRHLRRGDRPVVEVGSSTWCPGATPVAPSMRRGLRMRRRGRRRTPRWLAMVRRSAAACPAGRS